MLPRVLSDTIFAMRYCTNWSQIVRTMATGNVPSQAILRQGLSIVSPQNSLEVIDEIFHSRVYTPRELRIEPQDIVVDIGANIGVFSLYASRYTQNRIFAFEPFAVNFEYIKQNIASNNITNITPVCAAVSDQVGTVKLYTTGLPSGNLLFDHYVGGKIDKFTEVECTTLQKIMTDNQITTLDFLKLDCEGSEGNILQSTPVECLQRIRKIALEFHDNVSPIRHEAMQEILQVANFKTKCVWNGRSPFGYIYAWR
jgi:FkbM family methyltransferase